MKKVFITDYIKNPEIEQKIIGNFAKVICLNSEDENDFPEESAKLVKRWIGNQINYRNV